MELNDISFISHLYNYCCPPPYGTGSHSKLVGETIERSTKYARLNPSPPTLTYHRGVPLYSQCQLSGPSVVTTEAQGFFNNDQARRMIREFCKNYKIAINDAITNTIKWAHETPISEIGKGKQTLDCTDWECVKASAALEKFCKFLKDNGKETDYTLITFCEAFWELFEKDRVVWKKKIFRKVQKKKKYGINVYKKGRDFTWERKEEEIEYTGENKDEFLFNMLVTFETFRKDGERNKSKRRAIASPTIPLRAFFRIVEEFGKNLCRNINESTISIGGDEKKDKLQMMLNQVENHSFEYPHRYIVTGDNQKWNEAMASELFIRGMRCLIYFVDDLVELEQKGALYHKDLLYKIMQITFIALFHKRVRFGLGKKVIDKKTQLFKYLAFDEIVKNLDKMVDSEEKEMYSYIAELFAGENCLTNSTGMLMGMLNILSTFIGLLGLTYNSKGELDPTYRQLIREGKINPKDVREDLSQTLRIDERYLSSPVARVFAVQSSDDFFMIVIGITEEIARNKIKEVFVNCKLLGVNWSPSKTIIREMKTSGVGEYTSWFVKENRLVPQWGSDTAQLRPGGINCQSDLASGVRNILDKLTTRNMNYFGADAALRILCRSLRILYRIEYGLTPMGLPPELVCFANGGNFKYTPSNCHLDETSIILNKHSEMVERIKRNKTEETEDEKNFDKYVRRLVNPICPLNSGTKLVYNFDPDDMSTKTSELGVIMNCNNVQIRSNRKITNKKESENKRREVYNAVEKLSVLIRPSLSSLPGTAKMPLKESLMESLNHYELISAGDRETSEESKALYETVNYLKEFLKEIG